MIHADAALLILVWSSATIALYLLAKVIHRNWPRWWTMPLVAAPLLLMALTLWSHTSYRDYLRGTQWLVILLGPTTVAFAIPIYEQRALIRQHWRALLVGVLVGSGAAIVSSWALARLFGLDDAIRLSLLPRSMSTPFAMTVSRELGGIPDLTAFFVIVTGVLGAALGESILLFLPIKSDLARGALFGMAAHSVGAARAHQIGKQEGSIAGLVLVLAGVLNVLTAPLLARILHWCSSTL
jgi:predicted murein hydrolase (TIGR00659 family)